MKQKLLAGAVLLGGLIASACGGGYYQSGYYVRTAPPRSAILRPDRTRPRRGVCVDQRLLGLSRQRLALDGRPLDAPASREISVCRPRVAARRPRLPSESRPLALTGTSNRGGAAFTAPPRKRNSLRRWCCPSPCTAPPADMDTTVSSYPPCC